MRIIKELEVDKVSLAGVWVYRQDRQVADSGDVVIQERFSIVDTREPAIAISLSPFCLYSYRTHIFPVGCHQGVRRFIHLVYITLRQSVVFADCRTSKDIRRLRWVRFFRVWRRLFSISKASRTAVYWDRYPRAARKWWRGEGGTGVWWAGEI